LTPRVKVPAKVKLFHTWDAVPWVAVMPVAVPEIPPEAKLACSCALPDRKPLDTAVPFGTTTEPWTKPLKVAVPVVGRPAFGVSYPLTVHALFCCTFVALAMFQKPYSIQFKLLVEPVVVELTGLGVSPFSMSTFSLRPSGRMT
jgi:hypothetical protein